MVLDVNVKVTPDKGHLTGNLHHNTEKMLIENGLDMLCADLQTILKPLVRKVASLEKEVVQVFQVVQVVQVVKDQRIDLCINQRIVII